MTPDRIAEIQERQMFVPEWTDIPQLEDDIRYLLAALATAEAERDEYARLLGVVQANGESYVRIRQRLAAAEAEGRRQVVTHCERCDCSCDQSGPCPIHDAGPMLECAQPNS